LDLLRKVVGQHTLDQALSETTSRDRVSFLASKRHVPQCFLALRDWTTIV
jgi:hypothetical protein